MKVMHGIPAFDQSPVEWDIPNGERSAEELRQWWNRPFLDGQTVYCLDGGAWDRPTGRIWLDDNQRCTKTGLPLEQALDALFAEFPQYRRGDAPYRRDFIYRDRSPMMPRDGKLVRMDPDDWLEMEVGYLPEE